MIIIRDGKEIELTDSEIYEAYLECKYEFLKEDIASKAEDMGVELTEDELADYAERVDNALAKNDDYGESYWFVIENVLEES